jgi:hypothetical protein
MVDSTDRMTFGVGMPAQSPAAMLMTVVVANEGDEPTDKDNLAEVPSDARPPVIGLAAGLFSDRTGALAEGVPEPTR